MAQKGQKTTGKVSKVNEGKKKRVNQANGQVAGMTLDPAEVMKAMLAEARRGKAKEESSDSESEGEESEADGEDESDGSGNEDGGPAIASKRSGYLDNADNNEDQAESSSSARSSSRQSSPSSPAEKIQNGHTVPSEPLSRVKAPPRQIISEVDTNPFNAHSKPAASTTFASLGLSQPLINALGSINIKAPTEIQSACIGPILAGDDCIGGAKTGSGKTMAFALPIVERIARDPFGVWAVILTPTRELAYQLTEQFLVVGRPLGLTTVTIVGGMDMMAQARELEARPHIIVATPGRLCDLIRSDPMCQGKLGRVRSFVLDEADRLLTSTFAPDLAYIFSQIPARRQTCLFTATISEAIMDLAKKPPPAGKKAPFVYRVESDTMTVAGLKQKYLFIPSQIRDPYLLYLLQNPPEDIDSTLWAKPITLRQDSIIPKSRGKRPPHVRKRKRDSPSPDPEDEIHIPSTIIFTQRCATAHLLHLILTQLGVPSVPLHSKLSQPQRLASLASFRAREVPVLVTTDVGSRGLDIPEVAMVVNWDCPRHLDDYVHRVGRTARAGRGGVAVTIVTERDTELVGKIEVAIGAQMAELTLPEAKVLEKLNEVSLARRMAIMEMHDSNFGEREAINKAKAIKRAKRDAARASHH